jgi:hypothetical protein
MKVTASVEGSTVGTPGVTPEQWKAAASKALLDVVKAVAGEIEGKGRADIAQAGNFGGRWTSGFKAAVDGSGEDVRLDVTEDVAYWPVFQFGATITGRPLLYFKPTQAVGGLAGFAVLPTVISKHSVTIPKKFHLIEISQAEAERVPLLFAQALKSAKSNLGGGGS